MKKFFVFLVCLITMAGAFAVGENVPTSQSFVDTAIAQKQDKIPANTGATQVLTNTGSLGEIGTKNIYDASGVYAEQTDALVTAGDFNAAVQNAINAEFVCVSWVNDDPNGECLLMDIRGTPTQSILPNGYTALEYLESTGAQYINTGIVPGTYYSMELDFQPTRNQSTIFAGTRDNAAHQKAFTINSGSSDRFFYIAFGNTTGNRYIGDFDTNRHRVKLSRNGWFFDGAKTTFEFSELATTTSVYLFACNNNDTVQLASWIKIYNAKIWNNEVLVLNVIPARRDSDGELGMYDTITNTFFTNAGTGEFIAGPVANLYLPAGN